MTTPEIDARGFGLVRMADTEKHKTAAYVIVGMRGGQPVGPALATLWLNPTNPPALGEENRELTFLGRFELEASAADEVTELERARGVVRLARAAGTPISGAELARRFGKPERWGQRRIQEVRDSAD